MKRPEVPHSLRFLELTLAARFGNGNWGRVVTHFENMYLGKELDDW
jgi:hypothetical protein